MTALFTCATRRLGRLSLSLSLSLSLLKAPGENLSAHLVSFLSEPGVVFALIHIFFETVMSLCPLICCPREPHGHCISYQNFPPNKLDQSLGQHLSYRTTSLQALVVLWPQAERRQDLSSLSIPILHPSGRNFCTSSNWTASGSSTVGWHFRLAFASGPHAPEAGLGLQPQILVAPSQRVS